MQARLKDGYTAQGVRYATAAARTSPGFTELGRLVERLAAGPVELASTDARLSEQLAWLSRAGYVVFCDDRAGEALQLVPNRFDFELMAREPGNGLHRMARLAYVHAADGAFVLRHPAADCFLRATAPSVLRLLAEFAHPSTIASACERASASQPDEVLEAASWMMTRAGVVRPCDENGLTDDDTVPARRQWELHDAILQSRSRLGRTDQPVGATWRFKGELEPAPAVKPHAWSQQVFDLPQADVAALSRSDMPLTAAIEQRRSVRTHSIVPLTAAELGAFLFRACRIRGRIMSSDDDATSRPYPGGGALYEGEFYISIDRCTDLPRGFFYYDAAKHALCLISHPDHNLEAILEEARTATAGLCRPQVLITIASRHTRVAWKYSGIALATQLKNVGVIYQTMYLVATAMNLGGCALGLGNTDRFLAMTGLDWFEEGSLGEFMLGRPL